MSNWLSRYLHRGIQFVPLALRLRKYRHAKTLSLFVAGLALFAAGCSAEPPTATPDLQATVDAAVTKALEERTATTPTPTLVILLTPTPRSAPTLIPPTATSVPTPTLTPTATPTPRLTPRLTPRPTPTSTPTPTAAPTPTATPLPVFTRIELLEGNLTSATLFGKVLFRRELGDVTLVNDVDFETGTLVQALRAYRSTWDLVTSWGFPQLSVPTMYLTKEQDFIKVATDKSIEQPGYLAGFADLANDELYIVAVESGFIETLAHEVTHIAIQVPLTWLDEGIAEYVAKRIGDYFEPEATYSMKLSRRNAVRQAVASSSLLTFDQMTSWSWGDSNDPDNISLFYGQSWWLTEYLAERFGEDSVVAMINKLARGETDYGAFRGVYGLPPAMVLADFSNAVLADPLPEEIAGQSLCAIRTVRAMESPIISEWTDLISSDLQDEDSSPRWIEIARRYGELSGQMTAVSAPVSTSISREAYAGIYGNLADAAMRYSEQYWAAGNALVIVGNSNKAAAFKQLRTLFIEFPWGLC